ncbi:MAG: polysaccharide deacetylase [Clostridiaceae bacterium]|nr:polysaccharide deacetylase [Clostridiaceae bacterium]
MVLIFIAGFFIGGVIVKYKNNLASTTAANTKYTGSTEEKDDNVNTSSLDKKNQRKINDAVKTSSDYEVKRETEVHESDSMANFNPYNPDGHKVAYLTFDDGPSRDVTPKVLQILNKYNIKATFFIVGVMAEENKDLLISEKNNGHSIGNHTYSHNYKYIYASPQNLIADLNKNDAVLKSILGSDFNTKLIRFPGGSFGNRLELFRNEVVTKGYYYVDWNALNGDAEAVGVSKDKLITNIRQTSTGKQHIVVLMHDAPGKQTTIDALPQIIEYLKAQGYTFRTLR